MLRSPLFFKCSVMSVSRSRGLELRQSWNKQANKHKQVRGNVPWPNLLYFFRQVGKQAPTQLLKGLCYWYLELHHGYILICYYVINLIWGIGQICLQPTPFRRTTRVCHLALRWTIGENVPQQAYLSLWFNSVGDLGGIIFPWRWKGTEFVSEDHGAFPFMIDLWLQQTRWHWGACWAACRRLARLDLIFHLTFPLLVTFSPHNIMP